MVIKSSKIKALNFYQDSSIAMALWDTAESELYEGKFDIGWRHITKAKDILEKIIDQTDDSLTWARYCDIIFSMGYNLQVQNQMDSCYPYLMKSMQLTTDHFGPEHFINTMCLNKLSGYYEYIGDMKKEREALFKSFYIRRKILDSNDLFVAFAYMNMASYYYNLGDITKANMYNSRIEAIMQYHYEIYKQNKFDNSSKGILKYYSTFGWTPKTRNLFLLSIPRFYLATQFTLCEANLIAGNTDRAMFYYHNAQNYVANNPQVTVNISSRLSYMTAFKLVLENEMVKGSIILDSLISLNAGDAKHKPNYLNLAGALDLKAIALEKMGKTSEAYNVMKRCYEIGKIDFEYSNQFYFSFRLEDLANKLGAYEESLRLVDTALRKIMKRNVAVPILTDSIEWSNYSPAEINDILNQLKILFYAKYALAKRNNNKNELIYVQRLFETIYEGNLVLQRGNFSEKARLNQESEAYPLYENAINVSQDLFELTKEDGYIQNILKWSEASKVATLKKTIIKRSKERKPGGISRIDEIEELEHVLHNTEYRIIELKRNYKSSDSLQMSNLKNSLVYYNSELEIAKNQNMNELSRLLRPLKSDYPLTEVQEYLKNQSAVLVDYFWGDSVVVINVVNQDSIHSTIIKKKQTLDTDLEKYLALIKDPKSHNETVIQRLSDTLFQVLLAPVQNFILANHLIIIPDGVLNLIPFELLLKSHKENMDIRYEYSSNLLLNHHQSAVLNNSYVGFAPEYTGSESISQNLNDSLLLNRVYVANRELMGPLKFNTIEVKESADILGGKSFIGNDVNEDLFKAQSAKAGIVHLALHAMTDDKDPDYSQFLFKSNIDRTAIKPLYAFELNELNFEANLAILSACNTGIGKYQRGEGILSLARSFKHAGCENIIMSLWPANDASTKDIVVGFFKHLKAGEGKATALANSKRDFLKSAPEQLKHPFYWAGLVLIGDNEPMFKQFSFFPWLTGIVMISLMVLAFLKIRSGSKISFPQSSQSTQSFIKG